MMDDHKDVWNGVVKNGEICDKRYRRGDQPLDQ